MTKNHLYKLSLKDRVDSSQIINIQKSEEWMVLDRGKFSRAKLFLKILGPTIYLHSVLVDTLLRA